MDTSFQSTYMLSDWYPRHFNDLAKWDVNYIVPSGYNILCEGNRTLDTSAAGYLKTHYESKIQMGRFFPMILINNKYYKNYHLKIDDIALDYYFISSDTEVINSVIHGTSESFKFYRNLIGEYSFDNLKFVELPGENYGNTRTSLVLIGSDLITNYNNGWNEWPAHEVAHQWAGSGFYGSSDDINLWCIYEPMAEYLRLMYIEQTYGNDSLNIALEKIENEYTTKIMGTEKDIPLNQGGPTRALYLKGPLIFHKIRKIIGNENWINFLKYIYAEFKVKYFAFSDFKQSLSKFNADENTLNLLDKWISQPGMPE